jgi:hypothetical protein
MLALLLGIMVSATAKAQMPVQPKVVGNIAVTRSAYQSDAKWVIDYTVKNTSPAPVQLATANVRVKVDGWVSNSNVPGHGLPRFSLIEGGGIVKTAQSEVIKHSDTAQQCQEKMSLSILQNGKPVKPGTQTVTLPPEPDNVNTGGDDGENEEMKMARGEEPPPQPRQPPAPKTEEKPADTTVTIPGGEEVILRITLQHMHEMYGDLDPLLGTRSCHVDFDKMGNWSDAAIECVDPHVVVPAVSIPEPGEDHRDKRYFVSAPDSLYLAADIPVLKNYNVKEQSVRYSWKYRVRFYYLVATGGDGESRVRIKQAHDTPNSWKPLSDSNVDEKLKVGRWYLFDKIVRTQANANMLTVEFRITDEIGETWIDNLTIEPLNAPSLTP